MHLPVYQKILVKERYHVAHIATRNVVERTFGVWKRTFHVLDGEVWNK